MTITDEQKYKFFELIKKDAQIKAYKREYIKTRREKERENGIKQPSVISKNNTQNVYNYLYKQNAILCIKYLFK